MTCRASTVLLALSAFVLGAFSLLFLTLAQRKLVLPSPALPPAKPLTLFQAKVIGGAKTQIGNAYDASYRSLDYPMGYPPSGQGACTNVVIRSLRAGGHDLQALVHEDIKT